jgi:beta-galactosidase
MNTSFLVEQYDARNDSPMQRKLRRIRPWPMGCVFIQHPSMTEADIRGHFRLMRELGYTALKQCQVCRGTDQKRVMRIALDEGIIPFWFGEAGWEDPTPELLSSIGLDPAMPIEQLRENRIWLDRQERLMRQRIDLLHAVAPPPTASDPIMPGVPLSFDFELAEHHRQPFIAWLKERYGTIAALNHAWNLHHCMIAGPAGETGEFADSGEWTSWEHLQGDVLNAVNHELREYRRIRDVYRFKADIYLQHVAASAASAKRKDPLAPFRAGGEMGLFLPFASRGTDMEGIAALMKEHGSFYPSIHLAWHFEEVGFESVRPVYMQTSIAADWFKGGWAASWESTGGPQQLTGYKAPFVPKAREQTPGFTVDEGVMTQLMLSWIAGGFRGFGLWCWSTRTAGWEAGEYALLDRNNRPTPRAVIAGKIGQACRRLRDELWQARKEPLVGVLQDWDGEAIWAAVSRGQRDFFKTQPIRARIGVTRALINANVPWEHVTAADLRAGLAGRYCVIYLPACLAIAEDLLAILRQYVEAGGRVVIDSPGGWYDDFGQLLSTDDGSAFERLFGVRIADCQYSRPGNRPWTIDGQTVVGSTLDLQPTSAVVRQRFDHGPAAVTEHHLGEGTSVVLAWEASLMCTDAGHTWAEERLVGRTLGTLKSPYACEGAIAYRLAAPQADHYFLLNDGPATDATLSFHGLTYPSAHDAVSQEPIDLSRPIAIPAHSGRWVRCVKGP